MTISDTIPLSREEHRTVERAVAAVSASLTGAQRPGVAFSGGVDSSVLLSLATHALGAERVVALLGVSPSLAAEERIAAHDVASQVGVPVVEVETTRMIAPRTRRTGPTDVSIARTSCSTGSRMRSSAGISWMPSRTGKRR